MVMKHFQKYGWPAQWGVMKLVLLTRNYGSYYVTDVLEEVGDKFLKFLEHLFHKYLVSA